MSNVDTMTPTEPSVSYPTISVSHMGEHDDISERGTLYRHDVQKQAAHVMTMPLRVSTPMHV